MIKKILRRVLCTLISGLLLGIIIDSSIENIIIDKKISEFKNKGILDEELSSSTEKYYKVSRETWMIEKSSYFIKNKQMYYGNSGDIILSLESTLNEFPIAYDLTSFMFGGHCSFVCYSGIYNNLYVDNTYHIESTVGDGVCFSKGDFWNDNKYRSEVIGLRLKIDDDKIKSVFEEMTKQLDKKYNNTFIFNTKNTYYCSDLITRSFEKFGYDINYDGFYSSIQDIICSDLTYISFYKKYSKGITYYYYLE